jgi:hypothetical protein
MFFYSQTRHSSFCSPRCSSIPKLGTLSSALLDVPPFPSEFISAWYLMNTHLNSSMTIILIRYCHPYFPRHRSLLERKSVLRNDLKSEPHQPITNPHYFPLIGFRLIIFLLDATIYLAYVHPRPMPNGFIRCVTPVKV